MTAKQFFKSTAFKCIVVLVSIVLVCSVFLTICNALFYVSDEEKLNRAISKIYGSDVNIEEVEKNSAGETITYSYAADSADITAAYLVTDDGNYLVKSTGKGGYSGGTVTCWVVVKMKDGEITGIDKVVVDSYTSQTQMAEITEDSILNKFTESYEDGTKYTTDDGYMVTGSTKSSNAVCNAVNGAIEFVKTQICGDTVDNSTPYDGYSYTDLIDKKKTTHSVDGTTVNYSVVTTGSGPSGAFTIAISVVSDGTISSLEITVYGSTDNNYEGVTKEQYNAKIQTDYAGKNAAYFKSIIGDDGTTDTNANYETNGLQSGATKSNYQVLYACLFATANYGTAVQGGN